MKHPFVALLTDFGESDFFVPCLKATILSINPEARIIDVTHNIASFDVLSAAFVLFSCYRFFPSQTIFLAIVDPGVGSSRRILLAQTKDYFFVAPDNGILSLALEREEILKIREVTNTQFFLPNPSKTFEGRDKMAPTAAWLSKGTPCARFGQAISQYEKLEIEEPRIEGKEIIGCLLYQDKFGNLMTNIPEKMVNIFRRKEGERNLSLYLRDRKIASFRETYSSAKKGEVFFLVGSVGLIEIASREGSARNRIKAKPGDKVKILSRKKS